MRVTVLTTSFPVTPGSVSGIFIKRLVSNFPDEIEATVVTPCARMPVTSSQDAPFRVKCFRYAPLVFQQLAHRPGGIPAALRSHKLFYLLLPSFSVSMFLACLRLAKNSDVIHANWSVNGVIAGLVGRITRTSVLTTLRGTDVNRIEDSWFQRLLLRICLLLNGQIVTVSESIQKMIVRQYPASEKKLVFIPNGVDESLLTVEHIADNAKLHLLTVGNLVPGKGMDRILAAVRKLSGSIDFQLTIVGDGPERGQLESMTESLGLKTHVRFLGSVVPDEIPKQLACADIFILASYSEGRSNVVLEAMAAGVPVVASCIRGVDEIVVDGKTGLLFEPGDSNQLATRIRQLAIRPDLRERLGRAARQFVIERRLLWRETARRYAELYRTFPPQA